MLAALYFTLLQAGLSALGAVVFGAPLAYVLMRMRPSLSAWLESFLILPFFLPALSVVMSVLSLYGRYGLDLPVFGLFGISMAHWILNAPLVMLVVMRGYRLVPETHRRLAVQYDDIWRLIDIPVLKRALPLGFGLTFLYASLSFTIVLTLGGASDTTTLEVGIFKAIRYDYDFVTAAKLAGVQMVLGLIIYLFLRREFESEWPSARLGDALPAPSHVLIWFGVRLLFVLIVLFLLLPVAIFFIQGLSRIQTVFAIKGFTSAFLNSIILGAIAVISCQIMVALIFRFRLGAMVWLLGAISPIVLSIALILLLRPILNPFTHGIWLVGWLQGVAILPLVYGMWHSKIKSIPSEELKLVELLMPTSSERFAKFWWRIIWPILLETSALCFVLSLGDLGMLPLFSPPDFATLPSMVWQLIGSYKFDEARALGVFILMVSFCLLALSRMRAHLRRESNA